jgi:hypothetical protein
MIPEPSVLTKLGRNTLEKNDVVEIQIGEYIWLACYVYQKLSERDTYPCT